MSALNAAQRDQLARAVRCPKCDAQPYFACTRATVKVMYLNRPHKERVEAAISAAAEDHTDTPDADPTSSSA
jgi:hypothetical protein